MNFKTTIVLLILLVGAGVAVFLTNQSAPKDVTAQTAAAAKKLLNFNTADVSQLMIAPADGKPIVLKRDGMQWNLVEPIAAPAEASPPSEILSDLAAMASTGRVSATGADASATGLAPPQFKLELLTTDGHTTKLDIGSRSGTGDQLYVHLDGDPQDDLVQSDVYDLLDKPMSEFRRKKLLDVNTAQVQQVEVDRPEGKLVLQKIGANWVIKQPSIMPADNMAVTDLIMALSNLQANDFVSETDAESRRYGLESPSIAVTFTNTAPSTEPTTKTSGQTVKFGMLDVRKQYAYVSTSDGTSVARVSVSSMDAFKKTALDLRNKDVLTIDPTSVIRVGIETKLAATTRPTTRAASNLSVTLDRRPVSAIANSMSSTTSSTTTASTQPKRTVWQVTSLKPASDAVDTKVEALLAALHPLHVQQYDASPTTAPATSDHYTLTIECPPPLISGYKIELTDPGDSRPLTGRYNDLAFEVDRSLLDKIKTDFTHADEPVATPSASSSFPPGGAPSGPSGP